MLQYVHVHCGQCAWEIMGENDVVIEAFTELAAHYGDAMERELRLLWGLGYTEFIDHVLRVAASKDGDAVLDVATGTARIPLALVDQAPVARSAGLDITPAMLKAGQADIRARGLESRIGLVCASATNMPFDDGTFDLVTCALAMHHMSPPQVLLETFRVLKEGGQLVLADVGAPPEWRSPAGMALIRIAIRLYGLTHRGARAEAELTAVPNIRTTSEWLEMLSGLGFRTIEIVAQVPGRRPWFPRAIFIRAIKGSA